MTQLQNQDIEGRQYNAQCPLRFQQDMEKMFSVGLVVRSEDENPFQAQVSAYRGRNLRFAALRFSPHSTSSLAVGPRSNRLLVTLQKEGVALVQQDGRECRVEAGDIFMIDPQRKFFIETGEILTHSVYMEPEVLRNLLPDFDSYTARVIDGRHGTGALFSGMLDGMFGLAPTLNEDTADRIAESLPYVFSAALSGLSLGQPMSPSRLKQLHKQRIQRYIRDNLRDSDLSASGIASAVNLSTRYVYELFSDEEEPLMKRVWSSRLERCRAELASPAAAGRSIGEIAYYWGFNDVAHFSRAFRKAYGASPRDYRYDQTKGFGSM
ncbi:helix-turn-helix domain-containing protein [Pusillimonas noertemannii]|uniref:AraC family transcriptional regulator n=1 Tax=Pusillimonas noertemannii TaxID=305977 RepID=A0A2U1CP80_9BURK|nr:helix-turn-helix domain-containing protein [Pusillimonas noertemannii]NYT67022.1 helix-turn-helix domain-containing protein [Pusillimonas noertemannii]PVY67695.1 AraC family transcriptional regulator [Pusillimonas noertemannii]TFL12768.1 helix-turn-helix domain-containing protein [Pusillimonas noertemannii]